MEAEPLGLELRRVCGWLVAREGGLLGHGWGIVGDLNRGGG